MHPSMLWAGRMGRSALSSSAALDRCRSQYSGRIYSSGDMGFVTIVGDLSGGSGSTGEVRSDGKLAGAKVGGSVTGGFNFFAGFNGRISSAGDMGFVTIKET